MTLSSGNPDGRCADRVLSAARSNTHDFTCITSVAYPDPHTAYKTVSFASMAQNQWVLQGKSGFLRKNKMQKLCHAHKTHALDNAMYATYVG